MVREIKVELGADSYSVYIARGLARRLEAVRSVVTGGRILVITDANVGERYGRDVLSALEAAGFQTGLVTLPAGEGTKSWDNVYGLYQQMLRVGLTRSDGVLALGGGVIGDLAGFAAATYLRGVPYIQVPTSLLAQVDSSVGGKVAIDLPQGKNLVGSFYQPALVLIDPEVLHSLPDRVFADGMAEVIKYGCVFNMALLEQLEQLDGRQGFMARAGELIAACVSHKKQVVEQDPADRGQRMLLNFGHTWGHALETYYQYNRYTHGEAVAIGMAHITALTERRGITAEGCSRRLRALLQNWSLPYEEREAPPEELKSLLARDKKMDKGGLKAVVLTELGAARLMAVTPDYFLWKPGEQMDV